MKFGFRSQYRQEILFLNINVKRKRQMWCLRRTEKIKWPEKITMEQVLGRIGEKRTLPNNIIRWKTKWISHILGGNCLLHDVIGGQMTEVKGVGKKKKKTAPWWFEKKVKIEKDGNDSLSIKHKKYKLSSISPWTC